MVRVTKMISKVELSLRINTDPEDDHKLEYCFYDAVHLHSRLTIIVREDANSLYLDLLPF